jgi:hypothetical protein
MAVLSASQSMTLRRAPRAASVPRLSDLAAAADAYREEPDANPRSGRWPRQLSDRASWTPLPQDAKVGHRRSTTTKIKSRPAKTAVATIPGSSSET